MKILSRARDTEQLFRVSNIIDIDEIMELTAEDGKGFDENQAGILVDENIKGIKEDNQDLFENIELNTDVDVIIANARSKNISQSDSDLLDVMQFYTDANEVMNISKKLGLKIEKDMAAKFADRNLKLLLQKEEELIAAIRQATDLKDIFNNYSKLEICFARHNTNWRHDPEIALSIHEQEVQLIRQLLICCTAVHDVLELAEQLNIPFDEQRAIELLNEIGEDPELLHKMLNNEIKKDGSFYKKLIELMEDDPEYQSYKTKTFKNSREMVEFYFPNEHVMHLDLVYGYHDAEFAFATMFLHGIIVEYDLDKALYWLKRAYHDNSKEAFGLIKTLMEENNMLEELKEFCICCARIYDDREIKDYCAEHKIDYSKPSLKQDKLIKDYLLFYKRSPRNTTKRDRELIDLILTSQNENDTLKWIKELEPMANERLARMFYSAEPYYDGYDFNDEICDEPDPMKKQALMEKYEFSLKSQHAFLDYENDLNLTEREKLFMPRFVHDDSFLDRMEWNSPNTSQYVRHKTYHEQSVVEKVCYQMLDADHNLSFESAVTIVNILAKKEEKDIESRNQHREEPIISRRDMVFYLGAYYKRAAVFEKYNDPTEKRTIEEIMYDHMLNCIVCETVVNALIPSDIGAPMTWEAIKRRVNQQEHH